jgi:hypothetical protein
LKKVDYLKYMTLTRFNEIRNSYLKRSMINSHLVKQTFSTGNVLPLLNGAFAEVNAEAKHLVEKCARHAASLEDNLGITPEEARSAK